MIQCLAVLLRFYATGVRTEKSIEVLKMFGGIVPSLKSMRWVSENLLAFPNVGRRNDGSVTWIAQRDQTPHLSQFKHISFKETRDVFLHATFMFLASDDGLFGTRAADNQVKLLSNSKADKEGHAGDALADAQSRIVLGLRFRRQGETQVDALKSLLTVVFEGKGEQAKNG